MLQDDSVRNLQYDSDIRVAQPTRIEPISKNVVIIKYSVFVMQVYIFHCSYQPHPA